MTETVGVFDCLEVRFDHFADKLVESDRRPPAKLLVCLARVAEQSIHFRGTKIARVDFDKDFAALGVDARFVEALTTPNHRPTDMGEGALNEFAHRMRLARGQHEIVGLWLLHHPPHAARVILGVAPVAARIEIAEIEARLAPLRHPRHGAGDLSGDEGFAPAWPLMAVQNPVGGVEGISFTVIYADARLV